MKKKTWIDDFRCPKILPEKGKNRKRTGGMCFRTLRAEPPIHAPEKPGFITAFHKRDTGALIGFFGGSYGPGRSLRVVCDLVSKKEVSPSTDKFMAEFNGASCIKAVTKKRSRTKS